MLTTSWYHVSITDGEWTLDARFLRNEFLVAILCNSAVPLYNFICTKSCFMLCPLQRHVLDPVVGNKSSVKLILLFRGASGLCTRQRFRRIHAHACQHGRGLELCAISGAHSQPSAWRDPTNSFATTPKQRSAHSNGFKSEPIQ